MNVIQIINAAEKQVNIERLVIWNPFTSRALFVGVKEEIPKTLCNKEVTAYRYDKDKKRMILRVQA